MSAGILTSRGGNQALGTAGAARALVVLTSLLVSVSGFAAEVSGTWQGSYTCGQGLTGLMLTVAPSKAGIAQGVFRFYQVDGNPGVPDGCFAMSGTVSGDRIQLHAGHWLYRPIGYVTVDLAGTLSLDGTVLTGSIFGPDCTTFSLTRVSRDLNPAACRIPGALVS